MSDPETVALVPLRAGSKGLPGKNTRRLAGQPLYRHAVDQARAAGIHRVVISTDIEAVLSAPREDGLSVHQRPDALCCDTASMDAVLSYVLRHDVTAATRVILLQATSPLRHADDIIAAQELHRHGAFDLVLSTTQANSEVLKWGCSNDAEFLPLSVSAYCFANRAKLPQVYRPNGAIYVFDADWFRTHGTLAAARIGMIEMPIERSIDIDSLEDFNDASILLTK